MRRGTIFVVLFIIVAALVVGISQFLRAQPALTITVAVTPLMTEWARAQLDALNATQPLTTTGQRVEFVLHPRQPDDLVLWLDAERPWTDADHPTAWIALSSASVTYATAARLPFTTISPSLARTALVWGGFAPYAAAATGDGAAAFDWARVAQAAADVRWDVIAPNSGLRGNVNLAFESPTRDAAGLLTMVAAASAYANSDAPSDALLSGSGLRAWLTPVLESVNFTTLGADPAGQIAARGATVAQIALLPESEWLKAYSGALTSGDPFVFAAPAYNVVFDFPLTRWQAGLTADESAAVDNLANWLTRDAAQAALATFGLRQPDGTGVGERFAAAGAAARLDVGRAITLPGRAELLRFHAWLDANT
jgi:hypothetical protein